MPLRGLVESDDCVGPFSFAVLDLIFVFILTVNEKIGQEMTAKPSTVIIMLGNWISADMSTKSFSLNVVHT
eukprot:scaffold24741_cov92-Amphora_coffeaeformis.AAC.1